MGKSKPDMTGELSGRHDPEGAGRIGDSEASDAARALAAGVKEGYLSIDLTIERALRILK